MFVSSRMLITAPFTCRCSEFSSYFEFTLVFMKLIILQLTLFRTEMSKYSRVLNRYCQELVKKDRFQFISISVIKFDVIKLRNGVLFSKSRKICYVIQVLMNVIIKIIISIKKKILPPRMPASICRKNVANRFMRMYRRQ